MYIFLQEKQIFFVSNALFVFVHQYFSFLAHYSFLQSGYGVEAWRAKGGAELELHGSVRYECGARRVGLSGPALAAQRDA